MGDLGLLYTFLTMTPKPYLESGFGIVQLEDLIIFLFQFKSFGGEFFITLLQTVLLILVVIVVEVLSCVRLFVTPWTAEHQASLSLTISRSLLKFSSIQSVMPSNYLILCHPLSSCLPSFPASGSFPMSQLFPSGGQSTGVSSSASVLLMNIQD